MVVEGGTKKLVNWLLATVLIGEVSCNPFGNVRETEAIFFPKTLKRTSLAHRLNELFIRP